MKKLKTTFLICISIFFQGLNYIAIAQGVIKQPDKLPIDAESKLVTYKAVIDIPTVKKEKFKNGHLPGLPAIIKIRLML